MACARHLLLLLSLLPMSMAWKPKSLFLFNKRTGEACSDHSECQSRCCVPNSPNPQAFCAAKTLFLQCVPWRKPDGARCGHHRECRSQCCIALSEVSCPRCVRRSGLLAQCLPLVRCHRLLEEPRAQRVFPETCSLLGSHGCPGRRRADGRGGRRAVRHLSPPCMWHFLSLGPSVTGELGSRVHAALSRL
ncbi:leucine-rich colipase-like protein 1 isoform X2 [Mustela lutreola]|uniref:leucine-rich colipase-like protein 1 isoform X2 n=1 Tax=Mustela lutreola TaxID=9666 RepID=UPI002797510B|nr:leucine-rich colipase-like protein 1 isoform X2 [Mustela lutreola]